MFGYVFGYVLVCIVLGGEEVVIIGDFMYYLLQCVELDWYCSVDWDLEQVVCMCCDFLVCYVDILILIFGMYFVMLCKGYIVEDGDVWCFVLEFQFCI